jgi:hypothetical protein
MKVFHDFFVVAALEVGPRLVWRSPQSGFLRLQQGDIPKFDHALRTRR